MSPLRRAVCVYRFLSVRQIACYVRVCVLSSLFLFLPLTLPRQPVSHRSALAPLLVRSPFPTFLSLCCADGSAPTFRARLIPPLLASSLLLCNCNVVIYQDYVPLLGRSTYKGEGLRSRGGRNREQRARWRRLHSAAACCCTGQARGWRRAQWGVEQSKRKHLVAGLCTKALRHRPPPAAAAPHDRSAGSPPPRSASASAPPGAAGSASSSSGSAR